MVGAALATLIGWIYGGIQVHYTMLPVADAAIGTALGILLVALLDRYYKIQEPPEPAKEEVK
jgi:hypothetical protein